MKHYRSYQPQRLTRLYGAVLVSIFALWSATSASQARDANILRSTLSNGLRVVIVRDTLAPVVSTSMDYLVGSDESPAGFPGMAHAQEHMMFRGSPGLTADQLADIGSMMGGDFNAETSEGLTRYLFTVPAADLDTVLHIEALRMRSVIDAQSGWDKERGAIEQEVAQDVSNPEYHMYERLRKALFRGTPYEHDALGTKASFDRTTSQMLRKFHTEWYGPNNAIFVIVGDVDPNDTLLKVKSLFGALKPVKLPLRPRIAFSSELLSPITVTTDRPVASKILAMRFPGIDSPDFPALELLADVLSSRRFELYGLVPQGKAISADFSLDPLSKASIASASVTIDPNGDPAEAEREIHDILAKVVRDGVPPELVKAAKIQERRQAQFRRNSIEGLASAWSDAVALYGISSPDEDVARIERVTPAEVNRVAREYLVLDRAVSITMKPRSSTQAIARGTRYRSKETISHDEVTSAPLPEWARAAMDRLSIPRSTLHPVTTTLPNGITLIVQPENVSDTISVYGHIKNRPETETLSGKDGVAQVLDALFDYGSTHLDRIAFQKQLDAIGADESAGPDFSLQTLAQDFDKGVSLLADNELHPALPVNAMRVVRDQIREVVAARMDTPGYLARRSLRQSLFPKNDPSLREAAPASVAPLTMKDVLNYYHTAFRPDLTTIVVIGKVTPERARKIIEKYFGNWEALGPKPQTDLPVVPMNRAAVVAVADDSRVQDRVALAETISLSRNQPDYYALALGNTVLSGGFYSSRFSNHLRKNAGIVYSVDADLDSGRTRSVYLVDYACDPKNVSKAADTIMDDLTAMQAKPVSNGELARAKALLLRQIPLGEASFKEIAEGFAARRDLGLPLDEPTLAARHYVALNASQVQAAFRKWMRPKDLVRVSQGPVPK